jgi:hypothetical protein
MLSEASDGLIEGDKPGGPHLTFGFKPLALPWQFAQSPEGQKRNTS